MLWMIMMMMVVKTNCSCIYSLCINNVLIEILKKKVENHNKQIVVTSANSFCQLGGKMQNFFSRPKQIKPKMCYNIHVYCVL